MKCFYHADRDAVGTCGQCGKTSCRECIEDIGGALLCKSCMALRLREMKQDEAAVEAERQQVMVSAQRRIRASWIVFAAVSIFGIVFGIIAGIESLSSNNPDAPSFPSLLLGVPIGSLLAGYLFWGLFWGVPAVWRWGRGLFANIGCFLIANPVTWIILISMFFYIPLIGGYMYGALGGGIYEYLKYSRVARGEF